MNLYADVVSDQLISAVGIARESLTVLQPRQLFLDVFGRLIQYARRYWYYLVYALIVKKLYRTLLGRRGRRHPPTSSELEEAVGNPKRLDVLFRTPEKSPASKEEATVKEQSAYFSPAASNRGNRVIIGDNVVVVNRNDRYVEVYELKNSARVEFVEDLQDDLRTELRVGDASS